MAQEEQVLVIDRKVFDKCGAFNGLAFNVQKYLKEIFSAGDPKFMNRSQAEVNPDFKQIIPYVLISCDGRFLTYVRGKRAGETRLVSKRSMGIGGHINPTDDMPLFGDFMDTYLAAVEREISEEISIDAKCDEKIVAMLNDDNNEVGRVHLGVVHHWKLDKPNVSRKEQMITQLEFMTIDQLNTVKDTMETWSGLCLESIDKIIKGN